MNEVTNRSLSPYMPDDDVQRLEDEISLDGTPANRTLPRVAGGVLAASLLFGAAWSVWGSSEATVGAAAAAREPIGHVRMTGEMHHDTVGLAEALRRARGCYTAIVSGADTARAGRLMPSADRVEGCIASLQALKRTSAAASPSSRRPSDYSAMYATADALEHWIAATDRHPGPR